MFGALVVVVAMIIKLELESHFSKISQINAAEAVRLMDDEKLLVLDTREDKEYESGHIKGAMHIPSSKIKDRINELDKYKERAVLLYCRSGNRSNVTAKVLAKAGFSNVQNLAGGIMAWNSANLPVTKK